MALILLSGLAAIYAITNTHNLSLINDYRTLREKQESNKKNASFPFPRDRAGKETLWISSSDFVQPGRCDFYKGNGSGINTEGSWSNYGLLGYPVTNLVQNTGYVQIYRTDPLQGYL